jgi:hypothetical protein
MISDGELSELLETVLKARGRVTVPASGFSMGALFRSADGLVIERCGGGKRLSVGDVLVFRRFDRWVAHRVIRVYGADSPWLCRTRGDALLRPDEPPVRKGEEVGVVTGLVRGERMVDLGRGMARLSGLACAWSGRFFACLVGQR